jgi:hypothetical protein
MGRALRSLEEVSTPSLCERFFNPFLDNAAHIAASVEHALNGDSILRRFVVDEIVVKTADDPEAESRMARRPARARSEFRMLAEKVQGLFRL